MKISKTMEISAAHVLDGEVKCGRMHGHNYGIEVIIERDNAEKLKHGMVINYDVIKEIVMKYDHKLIASQQQLILADAKTYSMKLNGEPLTMPVEWVEFIPEEATAENIAKYIAQEIIQRIRSIYPDSALYSHEILVTVKETESSSANYFEVF
ncbi:MAG: 6-pyruvoyl tetrahydropterin synthase family protein [Candidatus Parvarchaeum sp.]